MDKLAYAAGLLDGEGCIGIHSSKGPRYRLSVRITNTDRRMTDWMKKEFGGHVTTRPPKLPRVEQYTWEVADSSAEEFLRSIYVYSVCKKEQIDIALTFRKTFKTAKTFGTDEYRRSLKTKLQSLYL